MTFSFPVYSLAFLAGGVISLVLAAVIWSRRPGPGIVPLTMLLIAGSIWPLAAAFEAAATDLVTKILFTKIAYVGVVSMGLLWLAFTLDYSGLSWWKRPRNYILLSLIPLITLAIAWTNEMHFWQWSQIILVDGPLGATTVWKHGPWYMVNPVYQYILYGWGIFVLCRYGWRKSRMHRMQIVLLLAGTAFPVFGNILYVLGINPASGFDLTPFYISSATIIYGVTIICFRLMDVLPVAYKALVKNIPDGILVLDAQLKIVEINPAMESIIGQSKKSVEGRPLFDVWSELGGLTAQAQDLPHAELTVGPMVIGPMSIGPISKQICLDASIVCLLDRHQNISGKLVVLRDISELKAAHQKLETTYNEEHRLRGRLEDEINKRSQYSRAVVHELRTPLTSIMASSELLEEEIKEPVHLKLVQNIRRSSSNMEQRVNELFELARGELGMVKIDPRPFDMGRLVREATAELAPVAAEKGLVLRSNLPAISLPVIGDEGRLKQVLINLVSNSLKFTTKGEIVIQTGYFDYQFLKVQVKDTGCGMGPGMLENLFDPYHRRMKENGASTGLGIGLALSKIFVELHCGRVWAESEPGKGTTISFTVPYAEAPPSGQLLNASGEAASGEINFR